MGAGDWKLAVSQENASQGLNQAKDNWDSSKTRSVGWKHMKTVESKSKQPKMVKTGVGSHKRVSVLEMCDLSRK